MNSLQFPEQTCSRQYPVNLKENDLGLFESDLIHVNKEKSMLFLKNIDCLNGVLFDKSALRFYDKYCFVLQQPTFKLVSRLVYYFGRSQKIEAGIWVTDDWSKEYFHWLTDVLTRILICEEVASGHVIVLPTKFRKYKYIAESLEILDKKFIFADSKFIHFKHLIVAPHTAITGNFDVGLINSVRDRFINNFHIPKRFIYISRQKARKRKILNEDQVIEVLVKLGFEIHFFEDYNLSQQIEIMQDTKLLLSIHGAGLTNMLFMPKNSIIFELRNEKESKLNCFFSMASALDHYYYYQTNQGTSDDTHEANLTVDTNNLQNELNKIMINTEKNE